MSCDNLDLYKVLGVGREATTEEIRATYKRLAKQLHPDKQNSSTPQKVQETAERFKTVSLAYSVLSDPEKRRRYDLHGPDELDDIDMDPEQFEIDIRDLGPVQKAILAVLGRTGFDFRTAVPETVTVLPSHKGKDAPPLLFGAVHHGKVERQGVQLYTLQVTHQQAEEGLVVSAYSPLGSRLKLLLYEETAEGWTLALQEDSQQLAKGRLHAGGLYFLRFDTYMLSSSLTDLPEHTDEVELTLFSRLRNFRKRDTATLRPGRWLVGVYGDNLYKRSTYTIKLLSMADQQQQVSLQQLRDVESELLRFRRSVQELEQQYRKLQVQLSHSPLGWGAAEQQGTKGVPSANEQAQLMFERLQDEADKAKIKLEEMLEGRRQAYTSLLQTIGVRPPSGAHLRGDSSSEVSPPVQCSKRLLTCAPDMQPLRTALHKQISGQPHDTADLPPVPTSPNSRYNMALSSLKRLSVSMSRSLKQVASRTSTPRNGPQQNGTS